MPGYELWLTDDRGRRLTQDSLYSIPLVKQQGFRASRVANGMGWFSMRVPNNFSRSLLKRDNMIQVWRRPTGGRMKLWEVYFLTKWTIGGAGASKIIQIEGPCKKHLLFRRVVAAFRGSSESSKNNYADDVMKSIVRQSQRDDIQPTPDAGTRVWDNFTVAPDQSKGPVVVKEASFRKLLLPGGGGVLPEIAKAARVAGTEVFFDVDVHDVAGDTIEFVFRTRPDCPARDVTDFGVLFDERRGTLLNPTLVFDYTEAENYIYALGEGEDSAQDIQQVYDADRYNESAWARSEAKADARGQAESNGVREAGRAALVDGEPRILFSASPVDNPAARLGRDWDFGYKVAARYEGQRFETIIRALELVVGPNGEQVNARLDYEQ